VAICRYLPFQADGLIRLASFVASLKKAAEYASATRRGILQVAY
jgi:hypothetical protein